MALRPVSELGLADATDVDAREPATLAVKEPPASPPTAPRAPKPRARRTARRSDVLPDQRTSSAQTAKEVGERRARIPLADEPTVFVQFMIAGELQERLGDASHALALEHRKLRHQKTILGALVWRHVDPDDADSLGQLGEILDAFLQTDIAEAPAETKVAAHLPYSLKWNLDGAVLRLRRTRRAATAKAMLSALVWRHVDSQQLDRLIPLLEAYQKAVRPRPVPLAAPGVPTAPAGSPNG